MPAETSPYLPRFGGAFSFCRLSYRPVYLEPRASGSPGIHKAAERRGTAPRPRCVAQRVPGHPTPRVWGSRLPHYS
jgi:hypothetical protein